MILDLSSSRSSDVEITIGVKILAGKGPLLPLVSAA